jgi:hypothetical protein
MTAKPIGKNDLVGFFEERPFPISRIAGIDTVAPGKAKHHIPVLFEVDVTIAREAVRQRKVNTGEGLSLPLRHKVFRYRCLRNLDCSIAKKVVSNTLVSKYISPNMSPNHGS